MTPSPSSSVETNKTNKTAPLTSGGLKAGRKRRTTRGEYDQNEIFNLEEEKLRFVSIDAERENNSRRVV